MKVCWNITNICNRDCVYCFRELIERARPVEDNIAIILKLHNIGIEGITYSGGEPLIYDGLTSLTLYSKTLGLKNNIITNGKILNSYNIKRYLSNIDKITFSIDSPSEYVNETSGRGKDHYQHIKEILPYIREFFPDILIEINSVVTNMNLQEVDFMFEAISTELTFYGINKWKILRFYPLRGYAKERRDLLSISDEIFEIIKERYDGKNALFEISVRDNDTMDEELVVSPSGSLKKSDNAQEIVLIDDIITRSSGEIKKVLGLGGYHV